MGPRRVDVEADEIDGGRDRPQIGGREPRRIGKVYSWQAAAAPKGLPPAVKARLESDITAAARTPEVKEAFEKLGFDVVATTGGQFDTLLTGKIARWKQVIETGRAR